MAEWPEGAVVVGGVVMGSEVAVAVAVALESHMAEHVRHDQTERSLTIPPPDLKHPT